MCLSNSVYFEITIIDRGETVVDKILFTVIVPIYNAEKYLNECLNSIHNQRYNNYEIILVDDGSSDRSGEICDAFYESNKSICKVIHKENQGALCARRSGLEVAQGKYIVFVDADDLIRDDLLELLACEISKTAPDVIIYQWQCIEANGNNIDNYSSLPFQRGYVEKDKIIESVLSGASLNSLCIKACKRKLFDSEIDYSEFNYIKNAEDLFQSIPIFEFAESFVYLPESLYYYRENPTSITHTVRRDQHKNLNVVRPQLYKMIERLNLDNEKNKKIFFKTYLACISNMAYQICSSDIKDKRDILDEILTYDIVIEAKKYLGKVKISKQSKVILVLLYARLYKLLVILVKLGNKVK